MTWFSTAPWFVQSPWMLLALLSTIVPLLIHLFSKSKGKLIPFGNIKLIQVNKPVRMNEIRLVKRLLLLCRLLLLLFSVLILAQFYYDDRANNNANIEGNILVTKDWLNNANEADLNTLALKAKVGVVFLLSKGSERLTSEVILAWTNNQGQDLAKYEQQNTWLLVKNYAETLPSNTKITVYTTNRLSQFMGNKVPLPDNIAWQVKRLPLDKLTDSLEELKNKAISVLIISDDDRKEDIKYLHAAFSLLKNTKLNNLQFEFKNADFKDILTNKKQMFDWVFHLSSAPVSKFFLQEVKTGTRLIIDAKNSSNPNVANLTVGNSEYGNYLLEAFTVSKVSDSILNIEQTPLNQAISKGNGKALWQSSGLFQQATKIMLEEYPYFSGKIFAFYSRFNPQWNDLVTQLQFPQMLLSLLLDDSLQDYQNQQQLTIKQIKNQLTTNEGERSKPLFITDQFKHPFIDKILIILLVLFWSIERVLSEINRVKQKHVSDSTQNINLSQAVEKSND